MEVLHAPPLAHGRRIRPPTLMLSSGQPDELGNDCIRFMMNRLRDDFGMPGVPMRVTMRKPKNPDESRAKKQR